MKNLKVIISVLAIVTILATSLAFTGCSGTNAENKINLAEAGTVEIEAGTSDLLFAGNAAAKEITADQAIEIAFSDAKVNANEAILDNDSPELDLDDRIRHYDVEFTANGFEYDYEIALDGKILKREKEIDDDRVAPSATKPSTNPEAPSSQSDKAIGIDDAKNIALNHAGVKASDVKFTKAKLDVDDGVAKYEIEFFFNGFEYDYEILASNGRIIDFDKERDIPEKTAPAVDTSKFISASEAKAVAFKKVGINESSARRVKCELDADERIAHYEVEFVYGGFEYDFDINAKTGKIMSFDKERA